MSTADNFDWNAAAIDLLKTLWAEGHSQSEIGRRIGCSKCAVAGKVGRLGLPGRGSPIRPAGEGGARRHKTKRVHGSTLPPIPLVMRRDVPLSDVGIFDVPTEASSRRVVSECCFPIDDAETGRFHLCGAPTLPRKPYCPAHAEAVRA